MMGLSLKQKDNLLEKISGEYFGMALTDKEQGILAEILYTEPVLKALGRIKADTDNMAMNLVNADLGDEIQRHQASVIQGIVRGRINTIEALLDLASLPEEEDDDAADPAAS